MMRKNNRRNTAHKELSFFIKLQIELDDWQQMGPLDQMLRPGFYSPQIQRQDDVTWRVISKGLKAVRRSESYVFEPSFVAFFLIFSATFYSEGLTAEILPVIITFASGKKTT